MAFEMPTFDMTYMNVETTISLEDTTGPLEGT